MGSITKNIFIEKVSLFYNLKLISEEQIKNMGEEFMLDVTYHPISVDEELFELSRDKHTHKSFISPRKKPNSGLTNFFLSVFLIGSILAIGYLLLPIEKIFTNSQNNVPKSKKIEKPINLPDHVEKNSDVETRVL